MLPPLHNLPISNASPVSSSSINQRLSPTLIAEIISSDQKLARSLQITIASHGVDTKCFESITQYLLKESNEANVCLLITTNDNQNDYSILRGALAERFCPPIIVISEAGDIPSCVRALKEGAHDYLTLPLSMPHLFRTIDDALEKDRMIRTQRYQTALLRHRWKSLTAREAEIMRYAVEGFLNKQTAAELRITENTVQVHRGRVMRKMRAESFAELVRMSLKLSE